MNREELYEEYSNQYPLIMGFREVTYEDWLQKQVIDLRTNKPLPPVEGAEQRIRVRNILQDFYRRGEYELEQAEEDIMRLFQQQPTVEGAEEITAKEYLQNKYPQMRGHLWNSNEHINDDWIAEMMEGFATLHAQRIAEKMVSERLREELIGYDNWMTKTNIGGGVSHPIEYFIDAYLKETGKCDVSAGKNVTKCHVNDVKNVTTEEDDDTLTPQDFFNLTSNHSLGVQARLKELGLFQVVCAEMKQYAKQFATLHAQRIAEKMAEEKWINVKDGLPEKDGKSSIYCLVNSKYDGIVVRPYNEYHKCWDAEDADDYYCDAIDGKITHWMPLPNPPIK